MFILSMGVTPSNSYMWPETPCGEGIPMTNETKANIIVIHNIFFILGIWVKVPCT